MKLTKQNVLLPLIVAMALGGCGSDDDDNTASSSELDTIKAKLTGTWTSACILETRNDVQHESYVSTMVVTGTELTNSGIEYSDQLCATQTGTWGPDDLPYVLAESTSTTVGGDGVTYDVYPADVTSPNGVSYTSVSLQKNDTEILLAVEDDGPYDGSTAAKRAIDFTDSDVLIKQ